MEMTKTERKKPEQLDLPLGEIDIIKTMRQDIPLSKLILSERNPRRITAEQMQKLQRSLKDDKDYLVARPICVNVVDGKYIVYAGNQRVRAAKKLGWKSIECHVDHNLSQEMIDKRIIKDNKTFGEFDFDMLVNEWLVDTLLDCGFQLDELSGCIKEPAQEKKKKDKLITCPNCSHQFSQ
jgi:DNA-directed RNA polymerase subunit RPC12/RpoP